MRKSYVNINIIHLYNLQSDKLRWKLNSPDEILLVAVLISIDDHLSVEQDESAEDSQPHVELQSSEESHSEEEAEHVAPEEDVQSSHEESSQVEE